MKWTARESVDVFFKAKSRFQLGARTIRAGEPVLIFDTVQTSTLEVAAETSYVTGGRGNARILAFEGDKTLAFSFDEALLSAEGLAILAGADLIPARNKNLKGASSQARSVISHATEKYLITDPNRMDGEEIEGGAKLNIHLSNKPYVGRNSSVYVMLLDESGEMSGAPVEINLENDEDDVTKSFLAKFAAEDEVVAFDKGGQPIDPTEISESPSKDDLAEFDDKVAHYVKVDADFTWNTGWGDQAEFKVKIATSATGDFDNKVLGFLVGQPRAFYDNGNFSYRVNVPSVVQNDVVLIDYYKEHVHDATQISILPDKFAPFMYVEGSSLIRRASDGADLPLEFAIPKFKITTALTLTLASTGDASPFSFQGDSYPDFSKFDPTRKVLMDIQILDADDNFDEPITGAAADPTSYRRYNYNEDDGSYLWKDPSLEPHSNIDYSDIEGPETITPGIGAIDAE